MTELSKLTLRELLIAMASEMNPKRLLELSAEACRRPFSEYKTGLLDREPKVLDV
jgi:hypothetical protein